MAMIIVKKALLAVVMTPMVLFSMGAIAADEVSDDLASLQKDEWLTVKVDGTSAADHSNHTISLSEDGSISGHTGCDTYSAKAVIDGVDISFTNIEKSSVTCSFKREAASEREFLDALGKAASFTLNVNVWRIYDASTEEVLELRRMGSFMVR
jgi:heat shock protein HslJ